MRASNTQRVELVSGGNLVVSMAVDLFALSESDRAFLFDIVDKVKTYRAAANQSTPSSSRISLGVSSSQDGSGEEEDGPSEESHPLGVEPVLARMEAAALSAEEGVQ